MLRINSNEFDNIIHLFTERTEQLTDLTDHEKKSNQMEAFNNFNKYAAYGAFIGLANFAFLTYTGIGSNVKQAFSANTSTTSIIGQLAYFNILMSSKTIASRLFSMYNGDLQLAEDKASAPSFLLATLDLLAGKSFSNASATDNTLNAALGSPSISIPESLFRSFTSKFIEAYIEQLGLPTANKISLNALKGRFTEFFLKTCSTLLSISEASSFKLAFRHEPEMYRVKNKESNTPQRN